MKVISTNLGTSTLIRWKGKCLSTGIYKYPVTKPILLETASVVSDVVADQKVHGGPDKACYLFSATQYPYWKNKYPQLSWDWGMFGENLTVEDLDEAKVFIGDIYRIGTALVQVSQPREPCFKLGIRFGSQKILREFISHGYSGTYVRVLEQGAVAPGDPMVLQEISKVPLSVYECFQLIYAREKPAALLEKAMKNEALPLRKREKLRKYL